MRAKGIVVVILLCALALSGFACGCGGEEEATPTPTPIAGYLIHTDEANGFAISFPDNWGKMQEHKWESWGVLAQYESDSDCQLAVPNFSVKNEELSQPMSVEAWFEELKGNLAAIEGYTPISEEELTVDGVAAIKHVFAFDVGVAIFNGMQLYMVKGTTGWTVTCQCPSECWSQYGPIFDTIAGSFRLLE